MRLALPFKYRRKSDREEGTPERGMTCMSTEG